MSTYEANRYNFTGANVTGIPTSAITSGTFADARLSSSSVTQHVDLSNLNASNLTSGTIPDARVGSSSVTQHVSAVTNTSGSWTPSASDGGFSGVTGRYHKTGNICICFADGKFSSRTSANNNQFFINGLPFTAKSGGNVQGGGHIDINSNGTHMHFPIVLQGESRIRIYSNASDMFTTGYDTTEYLNSVPRNSMIINRNLRQASNNGSEDHFNIFIYYVTA